MDSTRTGNGRQIGDDQDYPISRSFFPEGNWFRDTARKHPCCQYVLPSPISRDQELDELRQKLAGWKSTAGYWERRAARVELENQSLQRLLNTRQNQNAAPTVYGGVVEEHADTKTK